MKTLSCILLILVIVSCTFSTSQSFEKNWDGASYWEMVKGDSVIVADLNTVKAEMNIPLSLLTEDYQVVKLDKKGDLRNRLSNVYVTNNFIAISCYSFHPLKLFKKDGKFVREIGSLGTGKGEYNCIADVQIDEINNKIYILARGFPKPCGILVYDLQGTFLLEIPLVNSADLGSSLKVDVASNKILVTNGVTAPTPNALRLWIQDMNGNLLQGITVDKRKLHLPIYDTMTFNHTENTEVFLDYSKNSTEEYLSHYDEKENRLKPKFRVIAEKNYVLVYELPSHFVIEYAPDKSNTEYDNTPKFIVSKETLKGCQFTGFVTPEGLLLDQHSILYHTNNGYLSLMEQESQILKRILHIDKDELTKEQKKGIEHLLHLIKEDKEDGYLLFMAKFKNNITK